MRLNCSTFHASIGFYIDSHAALVRRNCYKFSMNFWNIWNVWIFLTHASLRICDWSEDRIMAKLIGVCMYVYVVFTTKNLMTIWSICTYGFSLHMHTYVRWNRGKNYGWTYDTISWNNIVSNCLIDSSYVS